MQFYLYIARVYLESEWVIIA